MTSINKAIAVIAVSLLTLLMPRLSFGADQPTGKLTVSLLTCAPGNQIYELEGHTGLRIRDNHGFDQTANWGIFNFNEPGFVYRFVKGETDYQVEMYPTRIFLDQYRNEKRRVSEQVLLLDSAQAAEVYRLVLQNLRPEKKVYRYNYVLDNCATRPLAIISQAVGSISLADPVIEVGVPTTFRKVMRFYHKNYSWYQFGIDIALGSTLDIPISKNAISFSPHALHRMFRHTTQLTTYKTLVAQELELVPGDEDGTVLGPTPWLLSPMAVAILILIIAVCVSFRDFCIRKCTSLFDSIYFGVLGLTGCVVAYLIFISVHEATSPNYNLLWLNPLLLLIPILAYTRWNKLLVYLQILTLAGVILYAIIWSLDIQIGNPAFKPLLYASGLRALVRLIFPTRK